jgi:hypothetical protein
MGPAPPVPTARVHCRVGPVPTANLVPTASLAVTRPYCANGKVPTVVVGTSRGRRQGELCRRPAAIGPLSSYRSVDRKKQMAYINLWIF